MPTNKRAVYLFSQESPKGEMFSLTDEQLESKLKDGWFDSPKHLDLPEDDKTGVTLDQAKDARPEDLVKLVESFGFIVVTAEQLKAEAVKMASVAFDPSNLTDEMIIEEAVRRGLKEAEPEIEDGEIIEQDESDPEPEEPTIVELQNLFNEEPEALTIPELIRLGNESYSLGLRRTMKEATLIQKINEAMA